MLGTEPDARGLIDGLVARVGAEPESAFLDHLPYWEAKRYLAELGDVPNEEPSGHAFSKSEFFRRLLPREAVESLVEKLSEGRVAGESR